MFMPLLQTKLYISPLRLRQVRREHLIARLHDHGARRLTLISAPAGFGKTTLVNEWRTQMLHSTAWLSLDEDDNDPTRFLTYLVAALRSCHENIGATTQGLLATTHAPPKAVLTLLLNDLHALPTPMALFLDDYHVITDPLLHEAMTYFIDHLPPTLHVVITSRIDPPLPIARWRARNHLTELRADDLRFGLDEAAIFLNDVMGLQLAATDILALETRTEGWITGLHLAALSLQGHDDRSAFIQAFSGSHRHVLGYLLEEVLNHQPDDIQNFLTQTAILERLCGPLCEAVTGQTYGFAMLMRLEQANLFITPLDDEGYWFRYHALFRQVLHARLQQTQAGAIAELHRRACTWCEDHGLLDEAMHHALATPGPDLAISLLERHAMKLLMQSELMLLRKWVAQLPDELIRTRPRLALAQAWVRITLGQVDAAEEALNRPSLQSIDLSGDLAGELALLRADIANVRRQPVALTWAQQALDLLPPLSEDLRTIALNEIGLAYMRRGDLAAAIQALQEVGRRAEVADNRYVAVDAAAALYSIQYRRGRLFEALQVSEQALRMVERWNGPTPPATGMIFIGLGEILCEWNELDKAIEALAQGLKLLRGTIEKMPLVRGYAAQARVRQAHGDCAGALSSLAQAEAWFDDMQITDHLALARLYAQRARLWIRQNEFDAALRWANERELPAEAELACEHLLTLVRYYLAQHRLILDDALLDQASTALSEVRTLARADDWLVYLLEERILQALTLHMQNHIGDTFTVFTEALNLAQQGGYIRIFLDEGEPMRRMMVEFSAWIAQQAPSEEQTKAVTYADKLLAIFPHGDSARSTPRPALSLSPPPLVISPLVEPLSRKELEVLHLIADGLSNGEIATKLVVTIGTVKSHVNHIFGKLGVSNRTQAVSRARTSGLLPG